MHARLKSLVKAAIKERATDGGSACNQLANLLDRANMDEMIFIGYACAEDYFAENVPPDLLALTLDDKSQAEITVTLVDHVARDPQRGDLIWIIGKVRSSVALEPMVRLVCSEGHRFIEPVERQAHFVLQDLLEPPETGGHSLSKTMGVELAEGLRKFVKRSLDTGSNDMREYAERTKERIEERGLGGPPLSENV